MKATFFGVGILAPAGPLALNLAGARSACAERRMLRLDV